MAAPASLHSPAQRSLRDYGNLMRRRRWFVVVPVLVTIAGALVVTALSTPRYASHTSVVVHQPPTAGDIESAARPMDDRSLNNELQRARTSQLLLEVRDLVGAEPTTGVRLAVAEDGDVLVFSASSADPHRAAAAADAHASLFIEARRGAMTQDLRDRMMVLNERIEGIDRAVASGALDSAAEAAMFVERVQYDDELERLEVSEALIEESAASVLDAARVADAPYAPDLDRNVLLALVVGLAVGVAVAFVVDELDPLLRDDRALAAASRLPVLAVIPTLVDWKPGEVRLATRDDSMSTCAEAYRGLRCAVERLALEGGCRTIQVTSPNPGDGKSTTSANLAMALAAAGVDVLLVDGDLRRPRQHRFFGLPNDVGLTTAVLGDPLNDVVHRIGGTGRLRVLCAGPMPPDPSELLAARATATFLSGLRAQADVIIVDSPPVMSVADPLILTSSVDAVLLVASAATTDTANVRRAMEQLRLINAPMLGAVLNSFDTTKDASYAYGYAYPSAYAGAAATRS